jgi:PKD repeat protein
MIRFGQRFAAMVAAALLLSVAAAVPVVAQQPGWSHGDQRVCSRPGADQARCASIARTIYRNGLPFQARTTAELAAAAAAASVGYFHGLDLRTAYGITADQVGDPSRVIAIVDAYDDRNAFANLTRFRDDQGMTGAAHMDSCTLSQLSSASNPCFVKVNQNGGTSLPRRNNGWANEIDLDLQAASSICPRCSIVLLEASNASVGNLGTAVTTASTIPGVLAISNSYGVSGDYPQTLAEAWNNATSHGIAVTASTGDGGYGPEFPASATNVIGVGGTTLTVDGSGAWSSETAWSGSGSGCSVYNSAPSWQSILGLCGGMKAIADVSADADPNTGLAVYTTYSGITGYWIFGGTSLSSPLVAALYAMQGGYNTSNLAAAYGSPTGAPYHDITSGSNGSCSVYVLCHAGSGWDGPTGLGSIALAASPSPTAPVASFTANPTSGTAPLTVQFNDTSTGATSRSWDFGDGSATSSAQSPSHTFAAGTWTVTLTVTNAVGQDSATTVITATAPPPAAGDFSIAVSPGRRNIKSGDTTTFGVTITPLNGYTGTVSLSLSGAPSGVTSTFDPSGASTSSTLTIMTTSSTPSGTYDLTITGMDQGANLSHTASVSLRIR